MKIHSIETVNLNSLYGQHRVDLESRLKGASLFLIYGPTGSGKSTLMDAVSLALFGETPRLDAARGVETADPRAVMSRGTKECAAEVVFSKIESRGRETYRARWACRRARKRADGTLQPAERSIERRKADGEWELLISSKKQKEFGPVFGNVLEDFTVKDFKRSMLLAQGQFDAFLAAPSAARAEILERLTDTSIYQHIGENAARIHARHKEQIVVLRGFSVASGGLGAEELAKVERAHALSATALERSRNAEDRAVRHLKWYEDNRALGEELVEADAEKKQVNEDLATARIPLEKLIEHERCVRYKAFSSLDAHEDLRGRVTELHAQIQKIDEGLPALQECEERVHARVDVSLKGEVSANRQLELLRPRVEVAEQAMNGLGRVSALVGEVQNDRKDAELALQVARSELSESEQALTAAQKSCEEAVRQLDIHRQDDPFVEQWGEIRTRVDKLVSEHERAANDKKLLAKMKVELANQQQTLHDQRMAYSRTGESELKIATQRVAKLLDRLAKLQGEHNFEDVRERCAQRRDQTKIRYDSLDRAISPVFEAKRAGFRLAALRVQTKKLSEAVVRGDERLEELRKIVEHRRAIQVLAAKSVEDTQRVADLVEIRSALVDGEACPLCGSEEHPSVHRGERERADTEIKQTVEAGRKTHDDAIQSLEEAVHNRRQIEMERNAQNANLKLLNEQIEVSARETETATAVAEAALVAAGVATQSSVASVEAFVASAKIELEDAEEALRLLDETRAETVEANRDLHESTAVRRRMDRALVEDEAKLQERATQLDWRSDEHVSAREKTASEEAGCRDLLSRYGFQIEDVNPSQWCRLGDQRRTEHEFRIKHGVDSKAEVDRIAASCGGNGALVRERVERSCELEKLLTRRMKDRDEQRSSLEEANEALAAVWNDCVAASEGDSAIDRLGDAPRPSMFLEIQREWWIRAKSAAKIDVARHQEVSAALASARTKRRILVTQDDELTDRSDVARVDLDTKLVSLGLEGEQALRKIRLQNQQFVEYGRLRAGLDTRMTVAETRIRERARLLKAHGAACPETFVHSDNREELAAVVLEAGNVHQQAKRAHREAEDRLRDHERAENDLREKRERLRQAEANARIWETLHSYIGVRDGGKFKEFAQALNLGKLLEKANVHLARLSTRYRLVIRELEGLPTLEFDLQDLWQVGERVAPRSLSGGERFIVSLSLALGLSDFRAIRMPIETLLLDEGFGTLDPETLSVALAALSQLQADGRQVGIISHVVGLRERVEARIEVRPVGGGRSRVVPEKGEGASQTLVFSQKNSR